MRLSNLKDGDYNNYVVGAINFDILKDSLDWIVPEIIYMTIIDRYQVFIRLSNMIESEIYETK
jgi:hypothetical protein